MPTFIDLFAGIGGVRLAFQSAGCQCVFSSEWDKFAQKTYEANFGEKPAGNIRLIDATSIPDHDILTGGFPCQSFSIAGVSKSNSMGRPHGFDDPTRGTLFFEIKRILECKRPKAFLLENVKNLVSHDKGQTFKIILNTLHSIGYATSHAVLDAKGLVPQHRERIFIVGFLDDARCSDLFSEWIPDAHFEFPKVVDNGMRLKDILESHVPEKYTLSDGLMRSLENHRAKHEKKGNGFGYRIADPSGFTATLSARYYKDGAEILIPQKGKNPRRLTPRECARLQGFPEDFMMPCSDTQSYKQFGNSVAVPVVSAIAKLVVQRLHDINSRTAS